MVRRRRIPLLARRWGEREVVAGPSEAPVGARSESGHALLLVLVVLVVLSASLHLVAASLASRQRQLIEADRRARVNALCDAALAKTLANLEIDRFYSGLAEEPFAGGLISSVVEQPLPMTKPLLRLVTVQADYAHRRRRAQAEVRVPPFGKPQVDHWWPVSPADADKR